MIKFNSSPKPTIGVEIELQLIDKNNLDLKNISAITVDDVLTAAKQTVNFNNH